MGAALGVAEPPGQVWVSLEVGVVGDRDSWWKGGEGLGDTTGSLRKPSPAPPTSPPSAPQAPLTNVLRKLQESIMVQGVYKHEAHEWVQGGLLDLGAPQPCQETCGDPHPQTHRPASVLAKE